MAAPTADATKFVSGMVGATGIPSPAMLAWIACESGSGNNLTANYNFLNDGNPSYNFASVQEAIARTANEINNSPYYAGIRKAIQTKDTLNVISAIVESPWATSHYGAGKADISYFPQAGYPPLNVKNSCLWKFNEGTSIGAVQDATPGIPDVTDPVNQIISAFSDFAKFFGILAKGSTWVRIGEVLGGIVILLVALQIINDDINVLGKTGTIATTAKKVAEFGTVAG